MRSARRRRPGSGSGPWPPPRAHPGRRCRRRGRCAGAVRPSAEQAQRVPQHPAARRLVAAEMAGRAEAPVADQLGRERLRARRRLEQRRVHRHPGRGAEQRQAGDPLGDGAPPARGRSARPSNGRPGAPRGDPQRLDQLARASRPWPRSSPAARRRCGHAPADPPPARSSRDRRNGAPAAARPNDPCRRRARTARWRRAGSQPLP